MNLPKIGTLREGSLHADLKRHYLQPGDDAEIPFGSFVIDVVRRPGSEHEQLIEIQTGSFAAMGRKLYHLLESHDVLVVHPISVRTVLVRGERRRVSPKRGDVWSLLDELVSVPTLLDHPRFEMDVVFAETSTIQQHDETLRRGRGGWRTIDRVLDRIVEVRRFRSMADIAALAGPRLSPGFTTADLAEAAQTRRQSAQKLAYCLAAAGCIEMVGRSKSGKHYRWV